tara:strand:- start:36685 stop:37503 length:819 start_codon:yes stop_codon:yes gene_type:complete
MSQEAQTADWVDDFKPKEEGSGNIGNSDRVKHEWLKFSGPGEYKVRLIGNAVKYLKHGKPFNFRDRVITHPDYKSEDPAWQAKFWPRKFYAIFCIDRRDGSIKILDKSHKFFEAISNYKKDNDAEPGSADAPDFIIDVKWPADKDHPNGNKARAEYSVRPQMKTNKLTEEEVTLAKSKCHKVKDHEGNEVSQLQIIFRSSPLSKIQDLWEALPDEAKIKEERKDENASTTQVKENTSSMEAEAKPEVKPEAPVAESASEADDLFGADESTGF